MMAMIGIFLPDIVKENLMANHLHSRHCIEYERRHEVCSDKQQLVETYFVSFTLLRSYKALSMTEPACRKFIRAVRYTTDNIYPSGPISSSWLPRSIMRPCSNTMIQSLFLTVERRWAMTKVVLPAISLSIPS